VGYKFPPGKARDTHFLRDNIFQPSRCHPLASQTTIQVGSSILPDKAQMAEAIQAEHETLCRPIAMLYVPTGHKVGRELPLGQ
jgi:hypothetical protein